MRMSSAKFRSENTFSIAFTNAFINIIQALLIDAPENMKKSVERLRTSVQEYGDKLELVELFQYLSDVCREADKPLVLMIDETDSAVSSQIFLDFLSQLRGYYIDRDDSPTFQSVILAGVYDIKNLKRKFRPEEDHKLNSPWNIAVEFKEEMSFSVEEIAGSGDFPEKKSAWTYAGFLAAERILVAEKNTLFESMVNKIYDIPELKEIVYSILFTGRESSYNALNQAIGMAQMLGFVKNEKGLVVIANKIFEIVFYNLFLSSAESQNTDIYKAAVQDRNQFICAGHLNMELLLRRFVVHFDDLYGGQTDKFKEEDGRRYFLLYLLPIINGTGNYYVESRTRNMERTDVIVDYQGEQIVVELKIWRGNAYKERGERQLMNYLDYYHLKKGYMLSFNFNKGKKIGVSRIVLGDKVLIEAVV